MFVGDEVLLDVSFAVARTRLEDLTRGGWLLSASKDAYGLGITGLPQFGGLSLSRLVRVQVRELTEGDESAGLALRWEVNGPSGGSFPVLDADIMLRPTGESTTLVTLAGVYRPLGSLDEAPDRAIMHRVGAATIRNFLSRVAAGITGQPGPAEAGTGPSSTQSAPETS